MSECRDLLFHVQEHRFTLPQLKEVLRHTGMDLLGLSLDPAVVRQYAARFTDDEAQTDLDHWRDFEAEFPNTFAGMYKVWVQKQSA
jgi:hypothetical protein